MIMLVVVKRKADLFQIVACLRRARPSAVCTLGQKRHK